MSELEVVESKEIILPTGELVDLSDSASCARALAVVREMEAHLREVKSAIVDHFSEEARVSGKNTIELPDGSLVQVKRTYDINWDHTQLEEDLRAAGMPDDRIREIIVEEVSWTVKALEANKAAKANPEYAKAIASARSEVEKRPTIGLPRG